CDRETEADCLLGGDDAHRTHDVGWPCRPTWRAVEPSSWQDHYDAPLAVGCTTSRSSPRGRRLERSGCCAGLRRFKASIDRLQHCGDTAPWGHLTSVSAHAATSRNVPTRPRIPVH